MIVIFNVMEGQTSCGYGMGMVLHTTTLRDCSPSNLSVTGMESPAPMNSFVVVFFHIKIILGGLLSAVTVIRSPTKMDSPLVTT